MSKILYDWVSITSKIHSPAGLICLLGLDDDGIVWEQVKGAHGYRDRLYWEKISIHYNGRPDMGIWLEMSGQGCRAFESFGTGDYELLFREVLDSPGDMHLTRLDVAFDDLDSILPMSQLMDDARADRYVSRWRGGNAVYGLGDLKDADSVTFGSRSSDVLCRIYNKAAERGFTDGRHWIRVELMLKDECALQFIQQPEPIGERWAGVLRNYLRFVDEPPGFDSNRWRWPVKSYWEQLLGAAAPIRLYEKPGTDYNMINLENFVFQQAGNAIYTYLETHTMEQFLEGLRNRGTYLNPKYKSLLAQYGLRRYNTGDKSD